MSKLKALFRKLKPATKRIKGKHLSSIIEMSLTEHDVHDDTFNVKADKDWIKSNVKSNFLIGNRKHSL